MNEVTQADRIVNQKKKKVKEEERDGNFRSPAHKYQCKQMKLAIIYLHERK